MKNNDKQRQSRVLVIEDHPEMAQLLCDILELKGCETFRAANVEHGCTLAKKVMPDIVLCDIRLPLEKEGLEFARQVRANPVLMPIPLIAVTGYLDPQSKDAAMEAGFNAVLPKPFKFSDLSLLLNQYGVVDV